MTCFLRELGLQALSRSPAVASPRAKGTAASPQICRPRSCCTPSVDPDAWLANIAPIHFVEDRTKMEKNQEVK